MVFPNPTLAQTTAPIRQGSQRRDRSQHFRRNPSITNIPLPKTGRGGGGQISPIRVPGGRVTRTNKNMPQEPTRTARRTTAQRKPPRHASFMDDFTAWQMGMGQNFKHQKPAGSSSCFLLPGFRFGVPPIFDPHPNSASDSLKSPDKPNAQSGLGCAGASCAGASCAGSGPFRARKEKPKPTNWIDFRALKGSLK